MKKILLLLLIICVAIILYYYQIIFYGINMGLGQLKIITNSRSITVVLNDSRFPDSLKQKLRLVESVRKYAIDSLGLKDTDNYTSVYDQMGKQIMWVVQACKPYRFKEKRWTFPVVGSVPYKGFFNEQKANAEKIKLEKEGWDVSIFNPSGWSTLGMFREPILSSMLRRSDGDLASLIIHEMVHSTIYLKDSSKLNENLASFIGDRGAENFLKIKFGDSSLTYRSYILKEEMYRKKVKHMLKATKQLDSLYKTFLDYDSTSLKNKKKYNFIQKIFDSMDTLRSKNTKKQRVNRKKLPNNTYFIHYMTYESMHDELNEVWTNQYNQNIKALINSYKSKYKID